MKYSNPEVLWVGAVVVEIQGTSQMKGGEPLDHLAEPLGYPNASVGAYQADE